MTFLNDETELTPAEGESWSGTLFWGTKYSEDGTKTQVNHFRAALTIPDDANSMTLWLQTGPISWQKDIPITSLDAMQQDVLLLNDTDFRVVTAVAPGQELTLQLDTMLAGEGTYNITFGAEDENGSIGQKSQAALQVSGRTTCAWTVPDGAEEVVLEVSYSDESNSIYTTIQQRYTVDDTDLASGITINGQELPVNGAWLNAFQEYVVEGADTTIIYGENTLTVSSGTPFRVTTQAKVQIATRQYNVAAAGQTGAMTLRGYGEMPVGVWMPVTITGNMATASDLFGGMNLVGMPANGAYSATTFVEGVAEDGTHTITWNGTGTMIFWLEDSVTGERVSNTLSTIWYDTAACAPAESAEDALFVLSADTDTSAPGQSVRLYYDDSEEPDIDTDCLYLYSRDSDGKVTCLSRNINAYSFINYSGYWVDSDTSGTVTYWLDEGNVWEGKSTTAVEINWLELTDPLSVNGNTNVTGVSALTKTNISWPAVSGATKYEIDITASLWEDGVEVDTVGTSFDTASTSYDFYFNTGAKELTIQVYAYDAQRQIIGGTKATTLQLNAATKTSLTLKANDSKNNLVVPYGTAVTFTASANMQLVHIDQDASDYVICATPDEMESAAKTCSVTNEWFDGLYWAVDAKGNISNQIEVNWFCNGSADNCQTLSLGANVLDVDDRYIMTAFTAPMDGTYTFHMYDEGTYLELKPYNANLRPDNDAVIKWISSDECSVIRTMQAGETEYIRAWLWNEDQELPSVISMGVYYQSASADSGRTIRVDEYDINDAYLDSDIALYNGNDLYISAETSRQEYTTYDVTVVFTDENGNAISTEEATLTDNREDPDMHYDWSCKIPEYAVSARVTVYLADGTLFADHTFEVREEKPFAENAVTVWSADGKFCDFRSDDILLSGSYLSVDLTRSCDRNEIYRFSLTEYDVDGETLKSQDFEIEGAWVQGTSIQLCEDTVRVELKVTCAGEEHTVSYGVVTASGTSGDLSWQVIGYEKLVISGEGAMEDFDEENPAPWLDYPFSSVLVKGGVTSIGTCAFEDRYIETLTLPVSVTAIGESAFGGEYASVDAISYGGSRLDWLDISIGEDNDALNAATMTFADNSEGLLLLDGKPVEDYEDSEITAWKLYTLSVSGDQRKAMPVSVRIADDDYSATLEATIRPDEDCYVIFTQHQIALTYMGTTYQIDATCTVNDDANLQLEKADWETSYADGLELAVEGGSGHYKVVRTSFYDFNQDGLEYHDPAIFCDDNWENCAVIALTDEEKANPSDNIDCIYVVIDNEGNYSGEISVSFDRMWITLDTDVETLAVNRAYPLIAEGTDTDGWMLHIKKMTMLNGSWTLYNERE